MSDVNKIKDKAMQDVKQVAMEPIGSGKGAGTNRSNLPATIGHGKPEMSLFSDVPVTVAFEVGRTDISIRQLMELGKGSFISLRQASVDAIDVRVSGQTIAKAEAVSIQQQYGIRFAEIEIPPGVDLD